jgi:hypothetical protein
MYTHKHAYFLRCAAAATLAEAVSPPQVDNLLVVYAVIITGYALIASGKAPFLLDTLG